MNSSDFPLLAIRCLTYNQADYIRNALDGFVSQKTNFKFVAIIHDDASTDGTTDIIREYESKYPDIIKGIYETENQYSKHDGSLLRIMDKAIISTNAKYIAYCEGDDYWIDPNKLQRQVDFLESNPEYGLVYTKVRRFEQQSQQFIDEWGGNSETFESLLQNNTIPTPSVVLNLELFNAYHREIKPETHNWRMGDYPLWLYVAANSKIKFFPNTSAVYRILTTSASHFSTYLQNLKFRLSGNSIKYFFAKHYNRSTTEIKICNDILNCQIAVLDKNSDLKHRLRLALCKNFFSSHISLKIRIRMIMLILMPNLSTKIFKSKES